MKISEVVARSGVPASTLRYYERLGLLAPGRSANGYRTFDQGHLERLEFIRAAKLLGLELPEIFRLLMLADTGTCTGVKAALQPLLAERITDAERLLDVLSRQLPRLREAHEEVAACSDSDEHCRSECAFRVLSGTAQDDDRSERWRSLLSRATVVRDGDALRIVLSVDEVNEAVALVRAEHASETAASIRLMLDRGGCTIIAPASVCAT